MLLEGKQIADKIKDGLKKEVAALKAKRGSPPRLVAVQIGKNPSSLVYINFQKKAAESVGIEYKLIEMPESVSQSEAERTVRGISADKNVTAIILQHPLPPAIDGKKLISMIPPAKDAEGMHPENLGRVLTGDNRIGPCAAMAVMALLESTGVKLYGKEAVVVGHSDIVGKPLSLMLLNKFVTTTVCQIATGERGDTGVGRRQGRCHQGRVGKRRRDSDRRRHKPFRREARGGCGVRRGRHKEGLAYHTRSGRRRARDSGDANEERGGVG